MTEDDFDTIATKLEAFIEQHGRIKLLEIIEHLEGMEASEG